MALPAPDWTRDLKGKLIQYAGTPMPQRKVLNFTGDVSVVDDPNVQRTNVDLQLDVTDEQVYFVTTQRIVSQSMGSDIQNPGSPVTGATLFSSGGYAYANDTFGGTTPFISARSKVLPDSNVICQVTGSVTASQNANDYYVYEGSLSASRTYSCVTNGAQNRSMMTFELLDTHFITIFNAGASPGAIYNKPAGVKSSVNVLYDGINWVLQSWKYRP